jgi:predicted phage baseplate assembly protein
VHATHGQTVEDEPLDDSEGLATHQRFLLRERPLTYTRAATSRGVQSTVQIAINGVRWQEVTSLERLDREKRKYALRQDAQGNTSVHFGHGARGSAIPSGAAQVTARYRKGLGREGNVAAGSLHLLQTAVPGLKGVTNPLAAAGGVDPETMDEAREEAPYGVRAMERIVSLGDYGNFARRFAGIGKAQATLLSTGRRQVLHITIAGPAGSEVTEGSDLVQELTEAIRGTRACSELTVHVDSFERAFFCLKARVWIEPDHRGRLAEIERAAKSALEETFAFSRREFGQPVAAAQVVAAIHTVPGVRAVELDRLYRYGQDADLNPLLEARCARWEAGQLCPAEMLLVKPVDGIQLVVETAP